jgi:hypothetical protein
LGTSLESETITPLGIRASLGEELDDLDIRPSTRNRQPRDGRHEVEPPRPRSTRIDHEPPRRAVHERFVRVAVYQNVSRVGLEQFLGRRAPELMTVRDVNREPAGPHNVLRVEGRTRRIDVAVDREHWRNRLQLIQH